MKVITIGRIFFSTSEFDKQWEYMGLNDDDRRRLENEIIVNPQIGSVMQGTGGLRKMRFAIENKSKRDSTRILYVDFVVLERVYLITAYPKSEKENISPSDREAYKKIIEQTKKQLGGEHSE